MRILEKIRLAWHTLYGAARWVPVLATVAGCIFLFLGIQIHWGIWLEKAEPCEMTLSVQGDALSSQFTSTQIAAIQSLDEVISSSLVWSLPAALTDGEYETELTLYGVDASFLTGEWLQGASYPDTTAMPYMVLNIAAVQSFRNAKGVPLEAADTLDWSQKTLFLKDEKETSIRICGVLDDGKEVPAAYLSIDTVKNLRFEAGMESPADTLWIRLKNSGVRRNAASALQELGMMFEDREEREADWNIRSERGSLYVGVGIIFLVCSFLMMISLEKWWRSEERGGLAVLRQMGISSGKIRALFFWKGLIVYGISLLLGSIVLTFL